MKINLASALLATTACVAITGAAQAADFAPASHIAAVTVYQQGADVMREVDVDVPAGAHRIILSGLPAGVDAQSIRVQGISTGSLSIGSVDTRNSFAGVAAQDARRKALEAEIESLSAERAALDMAVSDSNHQRTFLLSLADKSLTPSSTTEVQKQLDVNGLERLLDLVGQKLAVLAADIQKAQARQKEIDVKVQELSSQLGLLASGSDYRTDVVVNIEADSAAKGTLQVSYRMADATWVPFYDARLNTGAKDKKPALEIVKRAEVVQSTGEAWQDVALTLSTARPTGATAAPDMEEYEVGAQPVPLPESIGAAAPVMDGAVVAEKDEAYSDGTNAQVLARKAMDKPKLDAVRQSQAQVEVAGFQAAYAIPGRVSIESSSQSKKVRIASASQSAALEVATAPRLDAAAYLTAHFALAGDGPQLPGAVSLFRDGIYVGQGMLPLLNPNEETVLGFGVDDQVKVTRKEVKRLSGEEGYISSQPMEERAWDITVKNLHDFAMPVTVTDRVPFSATKDIEVAEISGMTAPTTRDVDKKRGVLAWSFTLEPNAENTLKTGYKITWPKGMQVGLSD